MQTTDVGNKKEGKVWHGKANPSPSSKGVMVTVIRSAAASHSKTVRFLHVAFDATGEAFLAGDHHGNVYVFDIGRNRFTLVQKTGQACTALAFNLRRTTEFLVALADHSIKCFDKDTKQLVSWMRGHDGAVSSVSVHDSGRYAITTSADAAQLWDLDTFQRKRKLNVRQAVGIQKVFFLPLSNTILSCFSDDTIFAWESDTLYCKYQLPTPGEEPKMHYRAFAVTWLALAPGDATVVRESIHSPNNNVSICLLTASSGQGNWRAWSLSQVAQGTRLRYTLDGKPVHHRAPGWGTPWMGSQSISGHTHTILHFG